MNLKSIVILVVSIVLFGCGTPKVDTSTSETMAKSLAKVRASLTETQQQEFDEVFMLLAFNQFNRDDIDNISEEELKKTYEDEMRLALNGKTGEQIILERRKINLENNRQKKEKNIQEINKLVLKKNNAIKSKKMLSLFKVLNSRIFKGKKLHNDELRPVIEIKVKNLTDHTIFRAYFEWEASNNWGEGSFTQDIPEGLKSGESATWKLYPSIMASDLPQDLILKIDIISVYDSKFEKIYSADLFRKKDENRLKELYHINESLK